MYFTLDFFCSGTDIALDKLLRYFDIKNARQIVIIIGHRIAKYPSNHLHMSFKNGENNNKSRIIDKRVANVSNTAFTKFDDFFVLLWQIY